MSPQQIAVLVVAATLGALVLLLLLYGRPRRSRKEGPPTNFSTGDPDSVLEGKRLQRVQIWGVASAIFVTGFLAVYFVVEPFRQEAYSEHFAHKSVERGEEIYFEEANCAQCHGGDGSGGFAATDPDWPAPPLNNVFYRYTRDQVKQIIEQGREGTPMPSWAVNFGGPLNEQKVNDVLNYLEEIEVSEEDQFELAPDVTDGEEIFARKCAVCHGPNATGQAMGQPTPSYYAPDLTTEFYRLGLQTMRSDLAQELQTELDREPTDEELDTAMAETSDEEIIEAGEETSRMTIIQGRPPTPMPGWLNRITEEQIDAVVDYLRSIQRVPEEAR